MPESCWAGRSSTDQFLSPASNWKTAGPGFRHLQEWVEVHWNQEEAKPPPCGTVPVRECWGHGESQLDAATATRKLITAGHLYGTKQAARIAAEFAKHGMIEVHHIYLLRGPPMSEPKPLDEYCTLLPYGEALQRIDAETDQGDLMSAWPEPDADNVCALKAKYFKHGGVHCEANAQYTSPLLRDGPEQLALLLGLVWGSGSRVFGNWTAVPSAAAAALPFRHAVWGRGSGSRSVALTLPGYGPRLRNRPLAVKELLDLAIRYSESSEQTRHRLARSMGRLRDSTERSDPEDKIIDIGIALRTVFVDEAEQNDQDTLVLSRAAWYYADSEPERRQTEEMLHRFYRRHSDIMHGRPPDGPSPNTNAPDWELAAHADDVVRACLKTLIAEGWPRGWDNAADSSAVRLDPPRAESRIPSIKSDSLSWSVEEQREIDRALEGVWKPIIAHAPRPAAHMGGSTVANLAPELVDRYRAEGIPYVVTHPARLYLAHPKWPKTASDSLGERTSYYCERDVERHTRQWREAASAKGLIQFEAPTDAAMYHPKCRDEWPRPLYSSHEADADVSIADRRAVTKTAPSVPGSMPTADADQRSDAEAISAAPPRAWPEPAVAALEREWPRLWRAFQHEVNVATNSLLHQLAAVHDYHIAERRRLGQTGDTVGGTGKILDGAAGLGENTSFIPTYPRLRAFPVLAGEPLVRRTAPGGTLEQNMFKAWVVDVYGRWESHYRNQLKHVIRGLPGAILPRQQIIGDLGRIRNDLVHHNGVAQRKNVAKCKILRWFREGERMQVKMRHILDFLNQMAWLNEAPLLVTEQPVRLSMWHVDRNGQPEESTPALVSVRPVVNPEEADPRYRYGASIAFENGVVGAVAMGPEREEPEEQAKERARKWMNMTVNEDGDLHVPELGTVAAAKLYRSCLSEERRPGPGIWQPAFQFRE